MGQSTDEDVITGPLPEYHYTPKHQREVKLHFMTGMTILPWLRLLWRDGHHFSWGTYGHRVLFLSFMALFNTFLAVFDWLLFRRAVSSQALHPEPIFILGHPRSGTTHLHNLLSLDPRFAFCTTFHTGFPSSFLTLEPLRDLLSGLLEPTRPMDNMKLTWDLPAEDEIAVNVLSGGVSPYLALVLPRLWRPRLRVYLAFKGPADVGAAFSAWQRAFLWFMRKVTYRHCRSSGLPASQPKPLLVKSPVHTGRLHIWLQMFPRARFIYIHRHPLQVFSSAAHMADTYYWYTYLQRPTDDVTNDFIMDQYDQLYSLYVSQRGDVPKGQLAEVAFQELDSNPLATLERIYKTFGAAERFAAAPTRSGGSSNVPPRLRSDQLRLDGFQELRPAFERYCQSLGDFKKNDLKRLPPEVETVVRQRWQESFTAFGYT